MEVHDTTEVSTYDKLLALASPIIFFGGYFTKLSVSQTTQQQMV